MTSRTRIIQSILTLILGTFLCSNCSGQTNYTTIGSDDWNKASSWDSNGIPSRTLANGDSIFIKHDIILDVNQTVLGVMIIENGASLTASNLEDIEVGKGGTSIGELFNYGSLTIEKFKVKPDNGCTADLTGLPSAYNYGEMTLVSLHIGNNCGRGSMWNFNGGLITVSGELHLDNYLCNQDTIYAQTKFKAHGGFVDCCGYIETPELDVDDNTGRPGTFSCIDICKNDGTDPIIDIDGSSYSGISDVYDNAPSSMVTVDSDSTLFCGYNQAGVRVTLPIDLVSFFAFTTQNTVILRWQTASEINNDFFTIERSKDGRIFNRLQNVQGAGNSSILIAYSSIDETPYFGRSYYRLKQTDFNGQFTYSKIRSVFIEREETTGMSIFPNPLNQNKLNIRFSEEIEKKEIKVEVRDAIGRIVQVEDIPINGDTAQIVLVSALRFGIYHIIVKAGNRTFTKKIIKN